MRIPTTASLKMVVDWNDGGDDRHLELTFDDNDPQAQMAKVMLIGMFNQQLPID